MVRSTIRGASQFGLCSRLIVTSSFKTLFMGDLSLAYDALDRLALHGDTPNQPFEKEDSSWVRVPTTQVPLATNIYIYIYKRGGYGMSHEWWPCWHWIESMKLSPFVLDI